MEESIWCSKCNDYVGHFENEHPAPVYQLHNGGPNGHSSDLGLFVSIEAAKAHAEKVLDSYHEFDGDDDVEPVNFDAKWEMRRETIGKGHEVGDPKPMLVYGQTYGTRFKITEREVQE